MGKVTGQLRIRHLPACTTAYHAVIHRLPRHEIGKPCMKTLSILPVVTLTLDGLNFLDGTAVNPITHGNSVAWACWFEDCCDSQITIFRQISRWSRSLGSIVDQREPIACVCHRLARLKLTQ